MAGGAANVSLTLNALARLAQSPESQSTIARLRLWVSGLLGNTHSSACAALDGDTGSECVAVL
jgi:hypothetical protein